MNLIANFVTADWDRTARGRFSVFNDRSSRAVILRVESNRPRGNLFTLDLRRDSTLPSRLNCIMLHLILFFCTALPITPSRWETNRTCRDFPHTTRHGPKDLIKRLRSKRERCVKQAHRAWELGLANEVTDSSGDWAAKQTTRNGPSYDPTNPSLPLIDTILR